MKSYSIIFCLFSVYLCPHMLVSASEWSGSARSEHEEKAEQVTQATRQAEERVQAKRAEFEGSLDKMFEDLDAAIAGIKQGHTIGETLTLAILKRLAPELLELASEVIRTHNKLEADAKSYKEELSSAGPVFLEAARTFRRFASEEPYEDLAKQYWLLSESLEAIARKYRRLRSRISPTLSAVQGNLKYVMHTAIFLERLEEVLFVLKAEDPETERFLANLTEYVRAFERLRKQLEAFHAATTDDLSGKDDLMEEVFQESSPSEVPRQKSEGMLLETEDAYKKTPSYDNLVHNPTPVEYTEPESIDSDNPFEFNEPIAQDDATTKADNTYHALIDLKSYGGVWQVGTSSTLVSLALQGNSYEVDVYSSQEIQSAVGTILVRDGTLHVERLIYRLYGGQLLDVSDSKIVYCNESTIFMAVPCHLRNDDNQYVRTKSKSYVKLHHLSRQEIEKFSADHQLTISRK